MTGNDIYARAVKKVIAATDVRVGAVRRDRDAAAPHLRSRGIACALVQRDVFEGNKAQNGVAITVK